ncbi:MAG: hypothetical protein ACR2PH_18370, partial [Desulfobulbia bacterium]
ACGVSVFIVGPVKHIPGHWRPHYSENRHGATEQRVTTGGQIVTIHVGQVSTGPAVLVQRHCR